MSVSVTGSGAEALLETVELDLQLHGQLVAELREPFLDLRDLGLPLLGVDREPRTPASLARALEPGFDVTLHEPAGPGRPWVLDTTAR